MSFIQLKNNQDLDIPISLGGPVYAEVLSKEKAGGRTNVKVLGGSTRKKLPSVVLKVLHGADEEDDDEPEIIVTVTERLLAGDLTKDLSKELSKGRPLNLLFRWVRVKNMFVAVGDRTWIVAQVVSYEYVSNKRGKSCVLKIRNVRMASNEVFAQGFIPVDTAWANCIEVEEAVLGIGHGLPASTTERTLINRSTLFNRQWHLSDVDEEVMAGVISWCYMPSKLHELQESQWLQESNYIDVYGEQVQQSPVDFVKHSWPHLWREPSQARQSDFRTPARADIAPRNLFADSESSAINMKRVSRSRPEHDSRSHRDNINDHSYEQLHVSQTETSLESMDTPVLLPGRQLIADEGWKKPVVVKDMLKASQSFVADDGSRLRHQLLGCEPRDDVSRSDAICKSHWRQQCDHANLKRIFAVERARGSYHATISSAKGIFSGDFRSTPFAHYIGLAQDARVQRLLVLSSTAAHKWNGPSESVGHSVNVGLRFRATYSLSHS